MGSSRCCCCDWQFLLHHASVCWVLWDVTLQCTCTLITIVHHCAGRVHSGFYKRTNKMDMDQIYIEFLKEHAKIVFTGHSLGAAIASLSTLRLLSSHPTLKNTVRRTTLGSCFNPMCYVNRVRPYKQWLFVCTDVLRHVRDAVGRRQRLLRGSERSLCGPVRALCARIRHCPPGCYNSTRSLATRCVIVNMYRSFPLAGRDRA